MKFKLQILIVFAMCIGTLLGLAPPSQAATETNWFAKHENEFSPPENSQNSRFSYTAIYDISEKALKPVIGYKVGTISDFVSKGFDLEAWSYLGVSTGGGTDGTFGVGLMAPIGLGPNARVLLGGMSWVQSNKPVSFGIAAGLDFKIKT